MTAGKRTKTCARRVVRDASLGLAAAWAAFLALGSIASADQAMVVTRAEAARVAAALRRVPRVVLYCAPCRGDEPVAVEVRTIAVRDVGDEGFEIDLNGEVIDAAYVYVPVGRVWTNLARRLRIRVALVPTNLEPEQVRAAERALLAAPTPERPESAAPLGEGCWVTGTATQVERTCLAGGSQTGRATGECHPGFPAGPADAPGQAFVTGCVFEDGRAASVVFADGAPRYALERPSGASHSYSFRDVAPNGEGIVEVFVHETFADLRTTVHVLASRGPAWREVVTVEVGATTDRRGARVFRAFSFPSEAPGTLLVIERRGSSRVVQTHRWNPDAFRFERTAR